jgi:dTDP-4-dehydrorhamnose 3,5-epimerase-like enzyme
MINSIKTENKPGILNYINNLNFSTKRLFYIDNFNEISSFNEEYLNIKNINKSRGFHANINFDEILIIINGEIMIKLIDKNLNITEKKLIKNDLFYIPRLNWIEFEILDEKTIIFALANEVFDKSSSIFSFDEFKNI